MKYYIIIFLLVLTSCKSLPQTNKEFENFKNESEKDLLIENQQDYE